MRRIMMVLLAGWLMAGVVSVAAGQAKPLPTAGQTEAVQVQLLRIELRKALLEAEAAPKVTAARLGKLQQMQEQKAEGAADAEVDWIQAQASEQVANLNVKSVEAQLQEAIKNAPSLPPQQPVSPTQISVLQLELAKAKINAAASAKVAENRRQVLAAVQANKSAKPGELPDADADAVATQANAGLLALEVQACEARLAAAVAGTPATPGK